MLLALADALFLEIDAESMVGRCHHQFYPCKINLKTTAVMSGFGFREPKYLRPDEWDMMRAPFEALLQQQFVHWLKSIELHYTYPGRYYDVSWSVVGLFSDVPPQRVLGSGQPDVALFNERAKFGTQEAGFPINAKPSPTVSERGP